MNTTVSSSIPFRAIFLALLLVLSASPCFAMMSIEEVTKERAKELGVVVRLIPIGPTGARVEFEFEAKGQLKNFTRADLEIKDGAKWISTSMREERLKSGRIVVGFAADATNLEKASVRIVTQDGERTIIGRDFRVKNLVAAEKAP